MMYIPLILTIIIMIMIIEITMTNTTAVQEHVKTKEKYGEK